MKIKTLFVIFLLTISNVVAQTDEKETINQLNRNAVDLFKSGKLDEAIKFAKQSVELSLKVYGAEHQMTGLAYNNLGNLQRERQKYGESVENLQKAIDIYQKQTNLSDTKLTEMYQTLGLSQLLGGKKKESEASFVAAINHTETKFGLESKELFTPILNLAGIYARNRNFQKADEYYLKSYQLAKKNFGNESNEVERVTDSRLCLNVDDKKRDSVFYEEYEKIFGYNPFVKADNVVNGKALKLVKPPYPQEAKDRRLTGTVKIRVKINEKGDVIQARAACGKGILESASEEAAWLSKFSPTLLNGQPVEVTGVIVYNFSAK